MYGMELIHKQLTTPGDTSTRINEENKHQNSIKADAWTIRSNYAYIMSFLHDKIRI